MYEELIKQLRRAAMWQEYGLLIPPSICLKAADAIEELSSFKEQITDGHFYCMRDGILYEAKLNPPKAKSIKLPPIKFAEQPKEKADGT